VDLSATQPPVLPPVDAAAQARLAGVDAGGLEGAAPSAVLEWVREKFAGGRGKRAIFTTGFGMEGCAMIDMIARVDGGAGRGETVIHYLDTHFLFAETHRLRDKLEQRYPSVRFVNAGTTLTPEQQAAAFGPALWETDPDACCGLRKVEPMRALLRDADVWVTALRREQSTTRAAIRTVEWDEAFEVIKVSPLAYWSREQVWAYVREHAIPYNELHDLAYPSVGCTHCTRPVEGARPEDYSRDGRWAGTGKTECGLHFRGRSQANVRLSVEGKGEGEKGVE